MWPFTKKPEVSEKPYPRYKDYGAETMQDMRKWRDIGETFEFLGKTFSVVSHGQYSYSIAGWPHNQTQSIPELKAIYVDLHGVVREISFNSGQWEAIKKANEAGGNSV